MADWKDNGPLAHYEGLYKTLDAEEISLRCNIPFDKNAKAFFVRVMGSDYKIAYPDFLITDENNNVVTDSSVKMLVLRFFCSGKWVCPSGKQLSYREIPWGELYFANFQGRCIKRAERYFGNCIDAFCGIFPANKKLQSEKLNGKKAGFRFEFMNNLFMSIIVWEGDDEFPSTAQILFDDNFPSAFTAEDIAAVGDVSIGALKQMLTKLP
jgi:hypothetical protein